MEKFSAFVAWQFFERLYPFNGELLKGNAFLLKAVGAKRGDGSLLQSKEFLLFGHGAATLVPQAERQRGEGRSGYFVEGIGKTDNRGVMYWEVQLAINQSPELPLWSLEVSAEPPKDVQLLFGIQGDPGQYFFIRQLDLASARSLLLGL